MKTLLKFLLCLVCIAIPSFVFAQSAVRPSYVKKAYVFTTVAGGAADTFAIEPTTAFTIAKHTTVLSGAGAVTPLLDSAAFTITNTYAKLGDELYLTVSTAGTARVIKFYGSTLSVNTADARLSITTNKTYTILFVYDGAKWRKVSTTTAP